MITQPLWPARMDTGRPPFSRGFSRLLVKVVAVATPLPARRRPCLRVFRSPAAEGTVRTRVLY